MAGRASRCRATTLRIVAASVLVLVAGACGRSGPTLAAAPPTRPDAGPITAPSTTKAPAGARRKSEPYWVPVAELSGTGAGTTKTFPIDSGAIQWRATYECQTAPFRVHAVKESGEELRRLLVDAAACGTQGKGYASDPGSFTLRIETPGVWSVTVEQQLDTPLLEPIAAALVGVQPVMTAPVYGVDRTGEGTVKVFHIPGGSELIRLEDFFVTINSDLELRLSTLPAPKTTDEIAGAPFVTVAPLKATVGSMNYPVPPNIDLGGYHSIVIWCEITRNAYAAASFA